MKKTGKNKPTADTKTPRHEGNQDPNPLGFGKYRCGIKSNAKPVRLATITGGETPRREGVSNRKLAKFKIKDFLRVFAFHPERAKRVERASRWMFSPLSGVVS
jgi:hypothetical protein